MTTLHHLFTRSDSITQQVLTYREILDHGFSSDAIAAAYQKKDLVKLRRGAYALTRSFDQADARKRALFHHIAVSKTSTDSALSHLSAALWWDAKILHLPSKVHLSVASNRNTRREKVALHKNRISVLERTTMHRGIAVTPPLQKVQDCAASLPLADALCVADDFLHRGLCNPQELSHALETGSGRGSLRCRKVASLMSALADSPAETLARMHIVLFGFEKPAEQLRIVTLTGRTYFADFAWEEKKVILEVDGDIKYSGVYGDPRDVVRQERRRQKELERAGWTVVRVGWREVYREPYLLKQVLWEAGLRPVV